MWLRWALYFAILATPAWGGTIDLSGDTSATVGTGDTLLFHLFSWNFNKTAVDLSLSGYPSGVQFAMASAPLSQPGTFAATLESEDRSLSASFGNLTFGQGYLKGYGPDGTVSTLEGYVYLSPMLSAGLFGGQSVIIALRNDGEALTLGLAPYLLRQSLYAGFSEERLSVGAMPGWVELETRQTRSRLSSFRDLDSLPDGPAVPEPRPAGLFIAGGVLLCAVSGFLSRISRRAG